MCSTALGGVCVCDDGYELEDDSIPDTRALSVTHNQQEERSVKRAKTAEMESEASAIPLPTPVNATKDGRVLDAIRLERIATHSHRSTVEEAAPPTRTAVTLDLINAILSTRAESVKEAFASASTATRVLIAPHPGIQNRLRRETSSATTESPPLLLPLRLFFLSWFSWHTICKRVSLHSNEYTKERRMHRETQVIAYGHPLYQLENEELFYFSNVSQTQASHQQPTSKRG